ncbi:MAG: hypothetical protein KR126chlam2_01186 [Chlamydiae bacterium]|nr:hypothetical protein [Chlamydiota bacterium]
MSVIPFIINNLELMKGSELQISSIVSKLIFKNMGEKGSTKDVVNSPLEVQDYL